MATALASHFKVLRQNFFFMLSKVLLGGLLCFWTSLVETVKLYSRCAFFSVVKFLPVNLISNK